MIRILLADDHAILRDGIRALLSKEPDMDIVGEAANGEILLELLARTPTDVVVMDVNMPVLDGFATMTHLRERHPDVRVLVLSMLEHENYVYRMLEAGALGYVLKNADITEIAHAIRTVAAGREFLCTEIGLNLLRRVITQFGASAAPEPVSFAKRPEATADLSGRELEVLRLIAEGMTNQEIADQLFTSKRTIETHRQNIIEKTQAKNTAALIRYAMNQGLIQ